MADLGSVIVGGLIASVSAIGSQWFFHILKTREERNARRAAKYEELIQAIYDFDIWLVTKRNEFVLGRDMLNEVSPFSRIHAIASVHFFYLFNDVKEFDHAADKYMSWMMAAAGKRHQTNKVSLDGHTEAVNDYVVAKRKLLNRLEEYALTHLISEQSKQA